MHTRDLHNLCFFGIAEVKTWNITHFPDFAYGENDGSIVREVCGVNYGQLRAKKNWKPPTSLKTFFFPENHLKNHVCWFHRNKHVENGPTHI